MMVLLTISNNASSFLSNVQQRLTTAHAKLITPVFGLLNHALSKINKNRQSETLTPLLTSI